MRAEKSLSQQVFVSDIADWEKNYDLPVHSSTITSHDTLRNVNVREILAAFENKLRQTPSAPLRSNSYDARHRTRPTRATNISNSLQTSRNEQLNRNEQVG